MVLKEDWSAAWSSEIFKNYAKNEMIKEAAMQKSSEQILDEELKILNDFEEFQHRVNASPKLKKAFKHLQHVFMTNSEYTSKVHPQFVEGVLLLNIED